MTASSSADARGQGSRACLRFGIVVDRESLPQWQLDVVHALASGGDAELCVLFRARETNAPPPVRNRSLWRLYNNGVVARRARGVAVAGRWGTVVPGVPAVDIEVERIGKWSQHVRDADLDQIRGWDLDFILRFGLGIIRGGILGAARYGIWSFHHDDERVIRGGPPGFWEVDDGLATTGVVLQRLTERLDGGIPLARANFRTILHSYPRNRDRTLLGAAMLPARVARAVRLGAFDPNAVPVSTSDAPLRYNPTNRQMLRFFAKQSVRAVTARARGVTRADRWAIGLAQHAQLDGDGFALQNVDWLPERAGDGYFADPFVVRRGGRTAILVEDFDEATNRGVISALEETDRGWELRSAVIDPGVHASYPFLVHHDGDLFCIPETWQARRVELWRCVEFPSRWDRAAVLIEGVPVVDPTAFEHEGTWWLLGTIKGDEPDAKLHAWSAPALFGPWTAHPLNPVKIDVTSSRPAGAPFILNGVKYRPAQDCSVAYGGGVVCNRLVAIDEGGLVEEPAARVVVPPGRYASGTHTLSSLDGMWVIDGRRYGRSLHRVARELRARLRRFAPVRDKA